MDTNQVVAQAQTKFAGAVEHFKSALASLRTGRANASMLDGVVVEAYGTPMPLNQLATVSAPEAQLIQISPFDPSNLEAISTAIRNNQSLGMNPSDDGRIIRVPIPALTEERRREIAKQIGQKQEECMISMRAIRHESINMIDEAKKDKDIGEDEAKRVTGQIEEAMTKARQEVEALAKAKEADIMTV